MAFKADIGGGAAQIGVGDSEFMAIFAVEIVHFDGSRRFRREPCQRKHDNCPSNHLNSKTNHTLPLFIACGTCIFRHQSNISPYPPYRPTLRQITNQVSNKSKT
jgi:hypothetical protein